MEKTEIESLLVCGIERFEVDFISHKVSLFLPINHCVDADGAKKFSASVDPEVKIIETYAGTKRDTCYLFLPGPKIWITQPPISDDADQIRRCLIFINRYMAYPDFGEKGRIKSHNYHLKHIVEQCDDEDVRGYVSETNFAHAMKQAGFKLAPGKERTFDCVWKYSAHKNFRQVGHI